MSSIEGSEAPLLATPEVESAAADAAAAGILGGDDSVLGPALEGEALEEEIRRQVEYYLSRDYLSTDPYLVSQMNSDMYFPITTVATLTTFKVDLEVLVKTLRKSTQLVVNENGTMVKPNFKIQRNTLILRDIPSSTKVEEVQSIFQGDNCPATTGIRPDIGDCWFVTFNSEEDALKALDFVRGRTFRDAPVKARIKSENLLRSFTYHAPAPPADLGMKVSAGQYAGYPYYPQYGQHAQAEHQDQRRTRGGGRQPGSSSGPRKEYRNNTSNTTNNTRYSNGSHPMAPGGSPALATPGVTSPPAPHANTRGSPQQPAADGERKPRRQPGTRTNTRKQEGSAPSTTTTATNNSANPSSPKEQQPLQFSNVHFPPLSSQSQSQPKHTGYTKDFTKFTKRQLIDIVTSTPVPTKQPASFPSDCLATLSEPNAQVVVSPESNLDRFQPAQEESVTKSEATESKPASTSTAPTPAQPTLASLVATHKSLPTPAPLPAPKRPQTKAKPGAAQPKREGAAAKDGKPQGHANSAQGKRTPSPPNARKGAAPQQRKRPEETPASQTQQPTTAATSTSTTTTSTTPSSSPAAAASPSPVAPVAAASPATAPAAGPSPTPASGPSTPTYAQLAAKAASKQPPAPQQKKEAEKKSEEAAPQAAPQAQPSSSKKDEKDSGGSKKEEKESASA